MRSLTLPPLDRPISAIGLGTATRAFTPGTYTQAVKLLDRFLEAGGNCVDTAHIYGFGDSEKTLGRWVKDSGRRSEIILITKGGHPAVDPANLFGKPWEPRVTPEALRADLNESLERLQTDTIDLYLCHRDDEAAPVGPLIEALNQEQRRGRVRALGASSWRVERMVEANQYAAQHGLNGFVISSPGLSLARPVKMLFPGTLFADDATRAWHRAHGFPMLAWASLAAGFMSGKFKPDDPSVNPVVQTYYSDGNFERVRRAQELGARKNATGLQIGLAFVLRQAFPVVALVGPTTVANLNETLGALEIELSSEEMEFLDLNGGEQ